MSTEITPITGRLVASSTVASYSPDTSKKYKTPEIWLLYPLNNEMRNHKEIIFDSGDETVVRVHFVDVVNIEKSLKELNEKIES